MWLLIRVDSSNHDLDDDDDDGGGGVKGRNLEEDLRWLRKKEERLRKEKLLLMQNEVFASPVSHDLDLLPEDVPRNEENDEIGERDKIR